VELSSPDVKKVFEEVSKEWVDIHGKEWDRLDAEGKEYSLSLGNKIIPLSREEGARWKAAVKPIINEYIRTTDGKGLPGKAVVAEAESMIKKYSKKYR